MVVAYALSVVVKALLMMNSVHVVLVIKNALNVTELVKQMMSDIWDTEELALRATGLSSEEADKAINDHVDIDDVLYEAYEISFEQYQKIVADLLPFTPLVSSPMSGKNYHAFVDTKEQRAIIKLEEKNE